MNEPTGNLRPTRSWSRQGWDVRAGEEIRRGWRGHGGTYNADAKVLNIIAGSEQETVLATIVKPWCDARGYRCVTTLKGSVDQARLLAAGSTDYDAYWFASSVFQQIGDKNTVLRDVKPMFLTPVVFAGWRSEMQRLGFAQHRGL